MAATGKTPILLYGSTTATNTPVAGNLTNSSDGCEIAINVADKNLFFKDSTNTVNTVPIRQSSTSSNGWLSSTDWNTFNNKQPAGTYVTSVTGTAPVVSSGGTTPAISMAAANGSTNGYLTSTDWNTFNNKVSSQWTTSGSSIYYTTGNVGCGTNSPAQPLHVVGTARVTQSGASRYRSDWYVSGGTANLNGYDDTGSSYIPIIYSGSTHTWYSGTAGSPRAMDIFSSGGVSIGNTTDPGATNLSVSGNVTLPTEGKGVSGSGGAFLQTSGLVSAAGYLDLAINTNGFVGILSVSATRGNYNPQSTRTVFAVACYGTTLTTTSLHTQNGSGGSNTFSVTCPSAGTVRVTDTSGYGSNTQIYITFHGAFNYLYS